MATVTKSSRAYFDHGQNPYVSQVGHGLTCGADAGPVTPCYIATADGKVYPLDGTADDEKAVLAGFTASDYKAGEEITLWQLGARFRYSDGGLTPGQLLYADTTAGALSDAPTTGGTTPIARAIDDSDIQVVAIY